MSGNSHKTLFSGIMARLLMLISAFLLLLSYASMVVNPAKAWYMTVFGLLFVPIAILNGIFLVLAIKRLEFVSDSTAGVAPFADIHRPVFPVLIRCGGKRIRDRSKY